MRCVANDVAYFFNYGRNLIHLHYSVEHATTINSAVHNVYIEWIIVFYNNNLKSTAPTKIKLHGNICENFKRIGLSKTKE